MPSFDTPTRSDNLALIFQEVLTLIMRLRAGRQPVKDAEVFRGQIRNAIKTAEAEARLSYSLEDLRMGTFATVAFLDETIASLNHAMFAPWIAKPLQEELFGVQTAGETFFRNVDRLLSRPDSETLADVLEIHQLCLLLGFHGRYRASGAKPEIREITGQIEEKMREIRGHANILDWRPGHERPERGTHIRNLPPLRWIALGAAVLAVALFFLFSTLLSNGAGELSAIARGMAL